MLDLMEMVSRGFDAMMEMLISAGSAWAIFALSFVTGLIVVVFHKLVSPQGRMRVVKTRIAARRLELRLFKDDYRFRLRALRRLLRHNLVYMCYSLFPMLILSVPIVLLLGQMHPWFATRPIEPGSTAWITVTVEPWDQAVADTLFLDAPAGVQIETPGLKIADECEVVWSVRADDAGIYDLVFRHGEKQYSKQLVVGNSMAKTTPVKPRASFLSAIRYPGETPLPDDSPMAAIDIEYQSKETPFLWWETNWLILFFLLSAAWGLLLRIPMGVEV